eukprot:1151362-Pelagomonas_calceolata.AAC.6
MAYAQSIGKQVARSSCAKKLFSSPLSRVPTIRSTSSATAKRMSVAVKATGQQVRPHYTATLVKFLHPDFLITPPPCGSSQHTGLLGKLNTFFQQINTNPPFIRHHS